MAELTDMKGLDSWFRYWMPYVFQKIEHPKFKHVYLPLNRNYKPIGCIDEKHVNYADFMHQAIKFEKDPSTFEGVWLEGGLYLYEDNPQSLETYFARLRKLMLQRQTLIAKII